MTLQTARQPHTGSNALVEEALLRLKENDTAGADEILSRALADAPQHARALQLMGSIREIQGSLSEAEQFYRRSLAAEPEQPHVHRNLGNVLKSLNRIDEAALELREAIRLKPNYAQAHLDIAIILSMQGEHEAAAKHCREALRIQPNYVLAKQMLAAELCDLGQPAEAEKLLRRTLALGLTDSQQVGALEHNLAASLDQQRRYAEALELFDAAQTKLPDTPAIDYNRANTLQHLGRLDEAAAFYRRAIARNPLHLSAHRDLNRLLYRTGDDEAWLKSYEELEPLYPDVGDLPLEKANFLLMRRDHEKAREAFEKAARLMPDSEMPHDGLALCLAEQGEFGAAVREHEIAVRMAPGRDSAWRNLAQTLLRGGDAPAALQACERAIAIAPRDQLSLALWGLVLRVLGDAREGEINDTDTLVRVYEIETPADYADIESFNRDLNAYLDGLHRDKRECIDQTLRAGTQTLDNLFGAGHSPIERLRERIDIAVGDYIGQMREDAKHPLYQRRSAGFSYAASWSSRLRDCGFHTNHVHSKGWISSAYYVALPDEMAVAEAKEGWIKFGEPNFELGLKEPVKRVVQPRVGTLVLFPSYMWHGTVPFRSRQTRTTIAFDVVPQAPGSR